MNSIYDELRAAIHSVWNRRWLALAVAWGVCLLGWLVVAMVPNSYESRARIFVQLDDALAEQIGIGLGDRKRDIDRVQQTLTSAVNLEKVVRSTRIGKDVTTPKQMEGAVLGLAKAIKVTSQQDNLFEITAFSRNGSLSDAQNAKLAQDIVQKMIDIFREENMSGGRGEMAGTLDFMNQQLSDRQKQLEAAEARRTAFETQHPEMVQGGVASLQRLESARSEMRNVEADLAAAQSALAAINGQLAGTPQTIAGVGPAGGARGALAQATAELAGMRARGLTDNHPDVIALKNQLASLRVMVQAEGNNAAGGTPNPAYSSLVSIKAERQANVQSLQSRRASLQSEVAGLTSNQINNPQLAAEAPGPLGAEAMCGFAGIFHLSTPKPVDPVRLERMCDAIAHRGPDGYGVWTAPGVGLGHRRLSIIDIAGSPQPMASTDGRAMLVFNGEIYNYRELREELRGFGAQFHTDGDSEVILAAWQKWGPDCLPRLHGMFAFAIYDLGERSLFLARDRLGVKPLFMAPLSDGSLIFGSELKALTAHPLLRREADPLAVEDYLAWGYVPDARSMLKGVSKLPAGYSLLLRHDAPMPAPRQWWDVSFAERRKGKSADLEAELLHLLRNAVNSRMVADVPLGAFLSGGVDSSSVVALMAEASGSPVKTCSIGFDVAALDESNYAAQIAERFATDHHSRVVSPDDFQHIDMLAAMFDEPFADASALPTWRVCQLARETVTVALSGDGADEAFAGYRRHVFQANEDRMRALLPQGLRRAVFGPLGAIYPKADWAPQPLRGKTTLLALAASSEEAYASSVSVTGAAIRNSLYTPEFQRLRGEYRAEDALLDVMRGAPARSGLDRAQYADLKVWLPGDILTKVDRTSMAVSLEAREPLLDHRLIEFAATLPEAMRVRGGQGKWLMKQTMRRYLPDNILFRPKQGFVTPIAQWLRGPLAGAARGISESAALARTGWFESSKLRSIAEAHIAGRSDASRLLWQLMMLDKSLEQLGIL